MSSKSYPAVAARGLAVCQLPFCRSSLVTACTERGILGALGNISHVFKLNGGVLFFQQHDTQGIPNSYAGHCMPMSMVHQELDFLLCKLLHTRVAVAHPAQLWDPPPWPLLGLTLLPACIQMLTSISQPAQAHEVQAGKLPPSPALIISGFVFRTHLPLFPSVSTGRSLANVIKAR